MGNTRENFTQTRINGSRLAGTSLVLTVRARFRIVKHCTKQEDTHAQSWEERRS